MIRTKNFSAEIDVNLHDGSAEAVKVLSLGGEDITSVIDDLAAWPAIDKIVNAEVSRLAADSAKESAAARLDDRRAS